MNHAQPAKAHIVVVDDDPAMRTILRDCLEAEQYAVSEANSRKALEQILKTRGADLVTLDIMLGAEDGFDIARELRDRSDVGIIMVTGRHDPIDTVLGLELGADDYVAKPFNLREVVARVRSVLRRRAGASHEPDESADERYMFGGWVLDCVKRQLMSPEGQTCPLTTSEFDLIHLLVRKPNRVLSREEILRQTRGADWVANDRLVDNQVGRLRRKMADLASSHPPIQNVRGVGYILAARVTPISGDPQDVAESD